MSWSIRLALLPLVIVLAAAQAPGYAQSPAAALVEAGHISPRDGQVRPGPRVEEFVQELDKLKLDVATIVGIHGDQASLEATRAAAKK